MVNVMSNRQWADQYGPQWYLHRDGTPPHDSDDDYYWTGVQWAVLEPTYLDSAEEDYKGYWGN